MPYMAFPSLDLGKKERKKLQKHPHSRSPIYNLLHWVSTVFLNALGNTIETQSIILMLKHQSLSSLLFHPFFFLWQQHRIHAISSSFSFTSLATPTTRLCRNSHPTAPTPFSRPCSLSSSLDQAQTLSVNGSTTPTSPPTPIYDSSSSPSCLSSPPFTSPASTPLKPIYNKV
jgi:hypothetical protein